MLEKNSNLVAVHIYRHFNDLLLIPAKKKVNK